VPRDEFRYPKHRSPLPPEYELLYTRHYQDNRAGKGLVGSLAIRLEGWMHRMVARRAETLGPHSLLELGAGTLNHLPYEKSVNAYDIVEPFAALYEGSPLRSSLRHVYTDLGQLSGRIACYDRIASIAVLEHVTDLPQVIADCGRLLRPDGLFQAAIPSEGAWAWYLAWRFGTGLPFRLRHGLDYRVVMEHEHLNTAREIDAAIASRFRVCHRRRFPPLGFHGSFYTYIEGRA
jgi:SAM-dependent methyltransferase